MAARPAIAIRSLTKRYGSLTAVRDLTLDVEPGEIFGFLGMNGAGKSTTVRILLDLLRPSSGSASILGHDCQREGLAARALTGYLPGELGTYAMLTGREVLDLTAGLSARPVDLAFRAKLQDRLELTDAILARKLREYSTGMKRKLGILQALQSDPPVLILDEPTEGLDPLMQETFHAMLREAKTRGRTVFMSSHVLSEVERVCDRVAVLRAGEVVVTGTVFEIRRLAPRRVQVVFSGDVEGPRAWWFEVHGDLGPAVAKLAGMPVKDLIVREPALEDVLIRYYRGAPQEATASSP